VNSARTRDGTLEDRDRLLHADLALGFALVGVDLEKLGDDVAQLLIELGLHLPARLPFA
jgi:hypothetical protein